MQDESRLSQWEQDLKPAQDRLGLPDIIVASWERSARAGVDRDAGHLRLQRLDEHEVTQRLSAARELLDRAVPHLAWLDASLAAIPHVIYLTDADGIVLHAVGNWPGGVEALGLEPGYDWSERTMGTNGAGTALATGVPVAVVGEEHYCADFHDCTCTGAPIRDANGDIVGAIDISTPVEHGNPERTLVAAHIAEVITQSFVDGERIRRAESLELLARFSGFLAHELVSPLAALSSTLELLSRSVLGEREQGLLERALRIRTRVDEVIGDLRVISGGTSPALIEEDLVALVRAALDELSVPDGVRVALVTDVAELPAPCQRKLVVRTLHNLIRNATQLLSDGGRVEVRLARVQDRVRITVADNGPGVPPELVDRLFERPFTTKSDGSGLGLLLAAAVVERVHGGRLFHTPNEPQGAQFHIDLPLE